MNEDLVPASLQRELVFVERTIQLQPDEYAPTFTMRVPEAWEHNRALVEKRGSVTMLVNDDSFQSRTTWGDPDMRLGKFEVGISSTGGRGINVEQRLFREWTEGHEVIKDVTTATDHTLIVKDNDGDGDIYIVRTWRLQGDSRFRSCWARVDETYAAAYRAFEKSCANVVEVARP